MKQNARRVFFFALCVTMWNAIDSFSQDSKLRISGFSEVRFEASFGEAADEAVADLYETTSEEADEFTEPQTRVLFPGFNLNLLSELSDKLYFQGEFAFQIEESEISLELYRTYLDYRINEKFSLQAGMFLSPIGYLNRNQRFYSFLNYSVNPRSMVHEDFGYIPMFTTGLQAYGTLSTDISAIHYRVAYGAMRGFVPNENNGFTAYLNVDDKSKPGFSTNVEWVTTGSFGEITLGLSAYSNPEIATYLVALGEEITIDEDDSTLVELELAETGFAPYIRFDANKFQLFAEYHTTNFKDDLGNTGKENYHYRAATIEVLYKGKLFNRSLYPYLRYDFRTVDMNHPFYGLFSEEGDELGKSLPYDDAELIAGFCWDIIPNNRVKVEYAAFTKGVTPKSRFSISTSFGF